MIYEFFIEFYNEQLAAHMFGYDCLTEGFANRPLYSTIGLSTIAFSSFSVVLFYLLINHPRFNRWYHWLIVLAINSGISFILGFYRTYIDLDTQSICPDLLINPVTGNQQIFISDCIGFGFVNSILALMVFVAFSFAIRNLSRNCSTCPIPN